MKPKISNGNKSNLKKNNNQNYNKLLDFNNYPSNGNPYQMYTPIFMNSINNYPYPFIHSHNLYDPMNFGNYNNIYHNQAPPQLSTGFYPLINPNNSGSIASGDGKQESGGSSSYLSTSEGGENYAHYYDGFGDNYNESLKKGINDITSLYNSQKNYRPKLSLLCSYYCNMEKTSEEESYLASEIQRLGEKVEKIIQYQNKDDEQNCANTSQ